MSDPGDSPAVAARKATLRSRIRHDRARLGPNAARRQARARDLALLTHPLFIGVRTVGLYVSTGAEPDTAGLRSAFAARGVRVLLPVLAADDTLSFAANARALRIGRHGLREPAGPAVPLGEADVVIVPALAVDESGRRLGQGGGSYDRALDALGGRVPLVALLHPGELRRTVPVESHDIPVDAAALPGGVVVLRSPAADRAPRAALRR